MKARYDIEQAQKDCNQGTAIIHIKYKDTNITYEVLFRQLLQNAEQIKLIEPYINTLVQRNNLERFLRQVFKWNQDITKKIIVETRDPRDTDNLAPEENSRELDKLMDTLRHEAQSEYDIDLEFNKIQNSLLESGSNICHDRIIETDTLIITLGRGLDIYCYDRLSDPNKPETWCCKDFYITINKKTA